MDIIPVAQFQKFQTQQPDPPLHTELPFVNGEDRDANERREYKTNTHFVLTTGFSSYGQSLVELT